MIISKTVIVGISPTTYKHYKDLGYFIPEHIVDGKTKFIKNAKIEVLVSDLPRKSSTKVLCACDNCKVEKWIPFHVIDSNGNHLCKKCNYLLVLKYKILKSITGKPRSKETKKKISQSNTGKIRTEETRRKISLMNLGRKHSEETKRKISQNNWIAKHPGKLHPNYNPNLTEEERKIHHYVSGIGLWRKKVLKRDNYTCQCCGSKEKLKTHHINNFSQFKEQRTNVDNGITLCFECHGSKNGIHSLFGKYTTKKDLIDFIKYYEQSHQ